jgi:hypothetical protein
VQLVVKHLVSRAHDVNHVNLGVVDHVVGVESGWRALSLKIVGWVLVAR